MAVIPPLGEVCFIPPFAGRWGTYCPLAEAQNISRHPRNLFAFITVNLIT